jgi:hypothetical protein
MHRIDRFVTLAVFVALVIYRLIRYAKAATTKGPRPAARPTSGVLARSAAPPAAASSAIAAASSDAAAPLAPPGTGPGGSTLAALAAFLVWALGNAAVWLCLLELPALDDVPVIWRLIAGVLASCYLVILARAVAARLRGREGAGSQRMGGNPFPDS